MRKRTLRLLAMVLALLLMISVVPTPAATAAPTTGEEVIQQIKSTYKKAKAYYGWDSFDGYCGALVNVQLHLLGITKEVIGADGRDAYDAFKNLTVTTGGYSVKAYPAKLYTLKAALNEITKNGTQDAYNILVGFEKTRSVLGRRYGHACVIHAILDGTVYFVESYDATINGVRYPEGTPLTATIEEFAAYYASTTTQFDGVIHFGLKTYADSCKRYPSNATGMAAAETELWSEPCENAVQSTSKLLGTTAAGQQLNITGLYLNTEGEYWYQLDEGDIGYIRAETVTISRLRYDDVTLTGAVAPTALVEGKSFNVKGSIMSQLNSIYSIRARVYSPDMDQMVQVLNATDTVQGKAYNLLRSSISSGLAFRSLTAGQYRYELAAIVGNHYVEAGQLMTGWDTVILWSSDFLVLEQKSKVSTITFDACGGVAGLDQTVVLADQSVGTLPVAQRPGYVFLGWFTQLEGGERITADFVPTENTACYAHWVSQEKLREQWMADGNCWYLYSDGISTMVCIEVEGSLYYFSSLEPMCQSWMVWTDTGAA
ncbi:MAG: InlB B-repeat-containing protein [Oscillospiraceae bacterium]|nr:InlB B-repeat-containing protein [Oscillospiraceae bacterium]